jgi:hypothetical protein
MWLLYRLGTENDAQARKEMFQTWRLLGFASVHLETVNFVTNNEYNDCETERGQPVN